MSSTDASRRTSTPLRSGTEQFRIFFILRKAIGNYCFVLLTNRASLQMSDIRPDLRQGALLVTSRAAWRWNKMLLARENVDNHLATMVVATEHNAL